MTFEEYCIKKKIDPKGFRNKESEKWDSFSKIFDQVSENSFTQQKKFLINDLRKSYPLKKEFGELSLESRAETKIPKTPAATKLKVSPSFIKKEKDRKVESSKKEETPASAKPKIKPVIKPVAKKNEGKDLGVGSKENESENKVKPSSGVSGAMKPKIKPIIKPKK